jgi:1-deoxy-D-xylulose-5-phosphate synthase
VLAPSSAQELHQMIDDAVTLADDGPVAIRYPRGSARQVAEHEVGSGLRARRVSEGDGSVCILAIGRMVEHAERAAEQLAAEGISATVWDVRSCAPLDADMIADAARHAAVVTVEDGIRDGGIGMMMHDRIGAIAPAVPVEVLGTPMRFIPHGDPKRIHARLGLDPDGIAASARAVLAGAS